MTNLSEEEGCEMGLSNGDAACNGSYDDDDDWYDELELVVQGREIVVSERLLVKHSRYFAHIFGGLDPDAETVVLTHGQLEDEEEVSEEKRAEPLTLISFTTMRTIVDFLETGTLKVGDQNVKHLLQASDLLAIGAVETECFNFLKTGLTVSNCVKRFLLADAKKSWHKLARHVQRFIQLRFDQLMKQTQIYQLTSSGQFSRILSDDTLSVSREEKALEAAMEWVGYEQEEREAHLEQVLGQVQWELIRNVATLKETLQNPMVARNPECVKMVENALRYHALSYEEKLIYWRARPKPSRWPRMLAALSYADKPVECFDFEEQRWRLLTNKPTATFGAELCHLAGRLYAVGGVQTKQVDRYDVEADRWAPDGSFPELTQFRVAHGTAVVGRRIFVMGGSAKASEDFGPGLDEMEVVTMEERSGITADESEGGIESPWRMASPMHVGRSYLASAPVCDRYVYVVGGCLSDGCSTGEVYDVETGKWAPIANTLVKRDSLGLATFDEELYAFGGYNDIYKDYVFSTEKYDPDLDTWTELKPMNVARRSPGVVAYRSKIYVVGGMGRHDDLKSAEVYDPILGTWSKFPYPMKQICGWVSCCLIEKPLRMMEAYGTDEDDEAGNKSCVAAASPNGHDAAGSSSVRTKRPRKSSMNSLTNGVGGGGSKQQRKESAPPSLMFRR